MYNIAAFPIDSYAENAMLCKVAIHGILILLILKPLMQLCERMISVHRHYIMMFITHFQLYLHHTEGVPQYSKIYIIGIIKSFYLLDIFVFNKFRFIKNFCSTVWKNSSIGIFFLSGSEIITAVDLSQNSYEMHKTCVWQHRKMRAYW